MNDYPIDLLQIERNNLELFIRLNNNQEDICFCGSSLKYKECHGFNLKDKYDELLLIANNLIKNSSQVSDKT